MEKGKPGAALGLVLRTLRALDVAVDLSADVPASKPAKAENPKAGKAAMSRQSGPAAGSRFRPLGGTIGLSFRLGISTQFFRV